MNHGGHLRKLLVAFAFALCAMAGCSPTPSPTSIVATAPTSTASGSNVPTVTPAPTLAARTFEDGEHRVGTDIVPGTYRAIKVPTSAAEDFCSWERVNGFGGSEAELIANSAGVGPRVATIATSDAGFVSANCGTWTSDLSSLAGPIGDGVWIVGTDIDPGRYSSDGGQACVWQRLSGFGGTSDESLEVGLAGTVELLASDAGFSTSHCGTWVRR